MKEITGKLCCKIVSRCRSALTKFIWLTGFATYKDHQSTCTFHVPELDRQDNVSTESLLIQAMRWMLPDGDIGLNRCKYCSWDLAVWYGYHACSSVSTDLKQRLMSGPNLDHRWIWMHLKLELQAHKPMSFELLVFKHVYMCLRPRGMLSLCLLHRQGISKRLGNSRFCFLLIALMLTIP